MPVVVVASAEVLIPLLFGAWLGARIRRRLGHRLTGGATLTALLVGAPAAVVGLAWLFARSLQ